MYTSLERPGVNDITGNILLLRGDITIQPANRSSVSYEFLSQLLGEYLLTHASDVDISAALSMMPLTTSTSPNLCFDISVHSRSPGGMNLNPLFVGYKEFRPSRLGGELQLFEQTGIELVHGWLVDPASAEYSAVAKTQDYDSSMDLIAEADHLTHGQLFSSSNEPAAGSSSSGAGASLMGEQSVKVQDGACSITWYPRQPNLHADFYSTFREELPRHYIFPVNLPWAVHSCLNAETRFVGRSLP